MLYVGFLLRGDFFIIPYYFNRRWSLIIHRLERQAKHEQRTSVGKQKNVLSYRSSIICTLQIIPRTYCKLRRLKRDDANFTICYRISLYRYMAKFRALAQGSMNSLLRSATTDCRQATQPIRAGCSLCRQSALCYSTIPCSKRYRYLHFILAFDKYICYNISKTFGGK